MGLITKLAAFTLHQAIGEAGTRAVAWIERYYADPTQALPLAMTRANDQTWRVIELALAGDGLGDRMCRLFASGTLCGVLTPLRERVGHLGEDFRHVCLAELRAARKAGLLEAGTKRELTALSGSFQIIAQPETMLIQSRQLVAQAAEGLGASYPNLTQLLSGHDAGGALLVTAFGYFLRQEIASQPKLCEELHFDLLNQIWQGQAAGWDELHRILSEQGEALSAELERIGTGLDGLAQAQAEHKALLEEILRRVPTDAQRGSVPPGLSSVLRSTADEKLFAELERRVADLPTAERTIDLLDALGRRAMAVGVFSRAGDWFQQATEAAGHVSAQAEAHYNRYRALLEQHEWGEALVALSGAAQLDPGRFSPFPLNKYEPQKILGAGGFGVAFLCHHTHLDHNLVIKTLHGEELDRDIAEVFREGRILKGLRHPAIIEVIDSDYAGSGQQRPYLVMEYFEGSSLERYLADHGPLTLDQTLALARPVAEALKAAHDQGVLHRDIKPDNLLVRFEKDAWTVKLIDFGLAANSKVVQKSVAAGTANHSLAGVSLGGTYQFSAPEQMGIVTGKVGPWSDVYAFGKTLCHALFKTTQPTHRHYQMLEGHPLANLLSNCLEVDIKQRPADFGQVLKALDSMDQPPPPTLSPGNPLDWWRLLVWVLWSPQHLKVHREAFGRESEQATGIWLVSTLIWLPFVWQIAGFILNRLPHGLHKTSEMEAMGLAGFVALSWPLTRFLTKNRENRRVLFGSLAVIWASLVVIASFGFFFLAMDKKMAISAGGVAAVSMVGSVAISMAGSVAVVVANRMAAVMAFAVALVVTFYTGAVAIDGLIHMETGVTVVVATAMAIMVLGAVAIVAMTAQKTLQTGEPSKIARWGLIVLLLSHAFIAWFSLLGGWRVFA